MLVLALVGGAILANIIVPFVQPTRYEGQVMLLALKMDDPHPDLGVQFIESRLQSITSIARSEPYLVELGKRAGVELDIGRLRRMVTATRPKLGVLVTITISGTDEQMVRALSAQAMPALDAMVDRVRAGAVVVLDEEGRNPFSGETSDYTGPIYTDMFRGKPFISTIEPSKVRSALAGGGLAALLVLFGAMYLHERSVRVTSNEDLDVLLSMPRVGSLGRWSLQRRQAQRDVAKGLALTVDGLAGAPKVIAVAGVGTRRERTTATMTLAVGLIATVGVPVVMVDLDLRYGSLSRRCRAVRGLTRIKRLCHARPGVSDAVAGHRPPDGMLRWVPRNRLPLALRKLLPARDDRLQLLPIGSHVGEEAFPDDGALGEIIDRVTGDGVVVVQLPDVPGPISVSDVLARADLSILVVMDGWAGLDQAIQAYDVLRGSARRTGYLLLDN
jgi:hypothetical protein